MNIKHHHTQLKIVLNHDEIRSLPELVELQIHQEKAPTRADPLDNHSICKINANRGFKPRKSEDSNSTTSEMNWLIPCLNFKPMVDSGSMEFRE